MGFNLLYTIVHTSLVPFICIMKIFEIHELDNDGWRSIRLVLIVKADTAIDARHKAAVRLNNQEIVTTGFYTAREVSVSSIYTKIAELTKEMSMYTTIH